MSTLIYREARQVTEATKRSYVRQLDALLQKKQAEAAEIRSAYSKDVGTDWLDLIVFEGTHEFCKDDTPIARLVAELMA